MIRLIPLLALFISQSALGIGFVIGNGGDAVYKDGKLVIRDLVEGGVEKNPYFGSFKNAQIKERVNSLTKLGELKFSKDLLTRKLSDLESISPSLGHYLFESIEAYNWVPVNEPLLTVPDPERILDHVPRTVVQVANRSDRVIRVDATIWKNLSPENQVALLIHEAIFSLLKPVCTGQHCIQPARTARHLTALVFNKQSYQDAAGTASEILNQIDVPRFPIAPSFSNRHWLVQWIPAKDAVLENFLLMTNLPLKTNDHFFDLIRLSCERFQTELLAYRERNGQVPFKVISALNTSGYSVSFKSYPTQIMGRPNTQLRLVIAKGPSESEWTFEFSLDLKNIDQCEVMLNEHYRSVVGSQ